MLQRTAHGTTVTLHRSADAAPSAYAQKLRRDRLGRRTVWVICSRLLQPTGRFRRRSLSFVVRPQRTRIVNSKEFRKARREFDKILGIPPSTLLRDSLLLLLSVICTLALDAFYESGPSATPGRITPPVHKPGLMVALFAFCLTSIASAWWVLARSCRIWQRQIALILIIFPCLFLFAMLLWLLKRLVT